MSAALAMRRAAGEAEAEKEVVEEEKELENGGDAEADEATAVGDAEEAAEEDDAAAEANSADAALAPATAAKRGAKGGRGRGGRGKKARAAAKSGKKKVVVIKRSAAAAAAEGAPAGDDAETDGADAAEVAAGGAAGKAENSMGEDYRSVTGVLVSQPTSRDIKIGNFSLISHGKVLIHDTMIELSIGLRYGLLGRNSSGKSTFLRCLANREVPIPAHVDIFLLEKEAPPSELTAIDYVVAASERRVKQLEEEAERASELYGPDSDVVNDMYERIGELDPATFRKRAGELLYGLGFRSAMLRKATKDMSGGWRMRVALAEALFVRPALLLLNQPSNHLDLEAVVWLEDHLRRYDKCLVVVSHSQDFLNNVCTDIIHLTPKQQLQTYHGNYDAFVRTRSENEVNQMKRYKKEQEDIRHIKEFIASAGTYANLVRQAKSKQKIIDKMVAAGLTEPVVKEHQFSFRFPQTQPLPPPVMTFFDVSFSYSGKDEDALYEHLRLDITTESRIALVGPNGAGKSTLLKLMIGELLPTHGEVRRHLHLSMARYHQHSADILPAGETPLNFVRARYADRKMSEEEFRQHLGRFGVRGEHQQTPIRKLSNGIKSRIVFALMSMERPNMLLLDEPTNHLDIECIDALADAIHAYTGGVVLVSHDFRLIDQIAKEIWVCDRHTVARWNGDIRAYKQTLIERVRQYKYEEDAAAAAAAPAAAH